MKNQHKPRLISATLADYPIIQNMARFYIYDRSRSMGWSCPEPGLFECIDFKPYFEEPDRHAFLVRIDNELAGFVLLDKIHDIETVDWNMSEFFILAKFQSSGVGAQVALELFTQFPGGWLVAVMTENIGAVAFWRKTISDISANQYTELSKSAEELTIPGNPAPYAMTAFSFSS
jgi:predicted acetyltransferase